MCLKRLQHMKALAEQGVSSVPAALPSDACQLQSTNGHCLQSCLVLMCLHFSNSTPAHKRNAVYPRVLQVELPLHDCHRTHDTRV